MAEAEEKDEQEPLTAEQRLDLLEKKLSASKLILFVIALFLIIIISVSVTAFSLFVVKNSGEDSSQAVLDIQTEVMGSKEHLSAQDERIADMAIVLAKQENQLANSGNKVIQSVLLDQEKNFQVFLASLHNATYDLAHMVPGSRAWLELYSAQIDESIALSQARAEKLSLLETSDKKEDSFFGDF